MDVMETSSDPSLVLRNVTIAFPTRGAVRFAARRVSFSSAPARSSESWGSRGPGRVSPVERPQA